MFTKDRYQIGVVIRPQNGVGRVAFPWGNIFFHPVIIKKFIVTCDKNPVQSEFAKYYWWV